MILGASKNPVEIKTPLTNLQYLSIIESLVVHQSYQITIFQIIQNKRLLNLRSLKILLFALIKFRS